MNEVRNERNELTDPSGSVVAVLFAREDSIYKTMPNVDVWDAARNALNWQGCR
jgi:hypothetical protein